MSYYIYIYNITIIITFTITIAIIIIIISISSSSSSIRRPPPRYDFLRQGRVCQGLGNFVTAFVLYSTLALWRRHTFIGISFGAPC